MLPKHDEISLTQRIFSATAITIAVALLGLNLARMTVAPVDFPWWIGLVLLAGVLLADLVSGLVHWGADTWGSVSMPIIGRRLLHPFRVHHVNPDDFLRRQFLDTNGDLAAIVGPILAATLLIGTETVAQVALKSLLCSFCGIGLLTNQIHQWAHMPCPPPLVRLFQDYGLILGREAHARHHLTPFDVNYCITTGWCNRPLAALRFFRRLERTLTWLTSLQPRYDEITFHAELSESSRARSALENPDVA